MWIDVNEEQPNPFETVLVACAFGAIMTSRYWGKATCENDEYKALGRKGREHYGKFGRWFEAAEKGYVVKYWMTLPEKPKDL